MVIYIIKTGTLNFTITVTPVVLVPLIMRRQLIHQNIVTLSSLSHHSIYKWYNMTMPLMIRHM